MPHDYTPQAFVSTWRNSELKERSAAQEHFIGLCRIVGHPTPAESDKTGASFTFEAGVGTIDGGSGWADVWKKGYFAWEYKGPHKDLKKAYQQLLQYRESLQNPPLLIVSDQQRIIIHTNFTNTVKREIVITLDDLLTADGLKKLRAVFYEPEAFRAAETTQQVTEAAAREFATLSAMLAARGHDPAGAAHFLIRLLFCLFAEDNDLLPKGIFTGMVRDTIAQPAEFPRLMRGLFAAMATGDWFGRDKIRHFNGGLFNDDAVVPVDRDGLEILARVAELDWTGIEPSILGTLFERSLDPSKRAQLGAHYTSKDDILLIVEPVLMAPLRRRWEEVRRDAESLLQRRDAETSVQRKNNRQEEIRKLLVTFAQEIASVVVLDPACGSGNFLYVALRALLDLEKEVIAFTGRAGLPTFAPQVSPEQLRGIEVNTYAYELAQATIWIGYIQWLYDNGFGVPAEPILRKLDTIRNMDSVLAFDADGTPVEPSWPAADVIVGNPPFLGGKKLREELGDAYVDALFTLYDGRVAKESDLVCYWFERVRAAIENGTVKRAGLLATNSIRGGANRAVLDRIKESGNIFMGWSDRAWVLDGASVRVSMVGFDNGQEPERTLDGARVESINSDLTSAADVTKARPLVENRGIAFMGDTKGGAFDIPDDIAQRLLSATGNPNGRPNSDVVVPWINGLDITRRPRRMWIIDFGVSMPMEQAAEYEAPFEHVAEHVRPVRATNKRATYRENWWLHVEARPAMRTAIAGLPRMIVTPSVAKHRLFAWTTHPTLPDHQLLVFARSDDYFLGVLHSRPHELWALRLGTALEDRPRYTPTTTFETFAFPWAPGSEPANDACAQAIADAARDLVAKRDAWLNPPDADATELKKRTLTNLYNARPTWLQLAHRRLDDAVFDAYGWPHDLGDDEIIARLLALNFERAGGGG